ncbi:MAG: DUF4157 domain-containing protein [Lachnospiraceae bacterium]|nr:DUF4157 domain-containing protein [Lachnospiraceae bacterium]
MGKAFEKQNPAQENPAELQHKEEIIPQTTMPNSMVMRIMEEPNAETEADLLSKGISSTSPAMLRREMGERLGADFSQVHFHSDKDSIQRSEALGARAWTQGRDVYFGKGGFDPSVGAHELVHTIQQGAVRGNASVSMPFGAVQLKPKSKPEWDNELFKADRDTFAPDNNDQGLAGDLGDLSQVEAQAMQTFHSARGAKVYNAIMPDILNMVKKAAQNRSGKTTIKFRPKPALSFFVRAAYQDYALRDILIELINKPIGFFKTGTRIKQYLSLVKSVNDRLGEYQAEELAMQTGLLVDEKGMPVRKNNNNADTRQVNKRSYELSPEDENEDKFNPGNIPEVAKIQQEIENSDSLEEAYTKLGRFTGNENAMVKFTKDMENDPEAYNWDYNVDLDLAKNKLKHMARMIWDYPELRHKIGDMLLMGSNEKAKIGVLDTQGGNVQTPVFYNAFYDRKGADADEQRRLDQIERDKLQRWNGDLDHAGNHELGHVLGSVMVSPGADRKQAKKENKRKKTENDIMKEVFFNQDVLTQEQKNGISVFGSDGNDYWDHNGMDMSQEEVTRILEQRQRDIKAGIKQKTDPIEEIYKIQKHYKGQINAKGSTTLQDRNLTSYYGSLTPTEFFAEAFGDVYTHGRNAKSLSSATGKEYEKRQKKLQRKKYKYNQSNWFMKLFRTKIK